ncbi:MAG: hypothetical protein OEY56_14230 [Cyclobacteriaceae bacterium]|nr:hypothetical protein [Cyclobacteriaceae bacterium]
MYVQYLGNKAYNAEVLCINKDNPDMHCEGICQLKKRIAEEEHHFPPISVLNDKFETAVGKANVACLDPVGYELATTNFHYVVISSIHRLYSVFHPPKG